MNEKSTPQTVLCAEQFEQVVDALTSDNSQVRSADQNQRRLIWSSSMPDEWETLVYKRAAGWEACFFRWPIHHEHATGSSFDSVRQRAEQRIRFLKASRLKGAQLAVTNLLIV